jgi:glycosyltransferase involved in cell wall biosynthesis
VSFIDQITVLILTYNEAPNIGRTLSALSRFRTVVVLDSGSNDETLEIVRNFENVQFFSRPFDCHAGQWNFGLTECGIRTPWVLALDADYLVPESLIDEIAGLAPLVYTAYRASFDYCVFGHTLSGTLYPAVTVLFRRETAKYIQAGHTQRLQTVGKIGALQARIAHDDRKPLSRWFASQQKYAKLEADYLCETSRTYLRFSDRIRRMGWLAPIVVFFYVLLIKRCIFDGWQGWFYVLQRTIAESMIALEIAERRLRRANVRSTQDSPMPPGSMPKLRAND